MQAVNQPPSASRNLWTSSNAHPEQQQHQSQPNLYPPHSNLPPNVSHASHASRNVSKQFDVPASGDEMSTEL